jgi:hypothetical protein
MEIVKPGPRPTIEIKYSCKPCGVVDVALNVPTRLEDQGVTEWMNAVAMRVTLDHKTKFPMCRQNRISGLKIPIGAEGGPQAPWIGARVPEVKQ